VNLNWQVLDGRAEVVGMTIDSTRNPLPATLAGEVARVYKQSETL
jgi:hypothetical protein